MITLDDIENPSQKNAVLRIIIIYEPSYNYYILYHDTLYHNIRTVTICENAKFYINWIGEKHTNLQNKTPDRIY